MKAAELMVLLRARYPAPEYAFFEQFANGTGGHRSRTADALAMSLWPSRGLELIGFELKVSRADWLRELKQPAKAECLVRRCDRWYIVVADEAILQPGELPSTWGLLTPGRGGKLTVRVEAPKLDPPPMDRIFLASLLRQVHEACPSEVALSQATEAGRKIGYAEGVKAGEKRKEATLNRAALELEHLQAGVKAFEEASGITFATYSGGRIGAAVKLVMQGQDVHVRQHLARMAIQVERIHASLQEVLSTVEAEA
jgi:hypothetical protein